MVLPPDSPMYHFDYFEDIVEKVDMTNHDYFLLGDINVNLMPGVTSVNATKLNDIFEIFGLKQLIVDPTRTTSHSSTLVGLCVTNAPSKIINSGIIELSISDHVLVYMTHKVHYKQTGSRLIEIRNMKNFNNESFLRDLERQRWSDVNLSNDPNEMWAKWKNMLINCIDKHVPLKTKQVGKKKSPWVTSQLKQSMRKRDSLKKKAKQTGDPLIWQQYKSSRNRTNNQIKRGKSQYFTYNLDANKKNLKSTWKLINELNSRNASNHKTISNIKEGDETISVGENLASEIPPSSVEPDAYVVPAKTTFSVKLPTLSAVYKKLKDISKRKAAGLDKIPCKLLKIAAGIVAPSLTQIFNKIISMGIYPTDWKLAKVTPIFKKGKKDEMNNYRPISVISVVAKIFEKLIFEQLYEYLNNNNLISASQSGFRTLHSALTALIEAVDNWSINIDNGLLNGVIFINLKKAFDTIDHAILLRKLQIYGVDQNGIKFFKSYLSNCSQRCCVNDELSEAVPITCGVPQGSNLGPLLFLIYINDLPNCLNRASPRMFADDTNISIAANSVMELEPLINSELKNLHQWLVTNRLSLNIAKTEFMIIRSCQRLLVHSNEHINIEIDGIAIKRVNETKSLGLQIDEHLTWAQHVENISKKIASAIGALKRVCQFIDTNTALKIYGALIQPYFDYCSSVWDSLNVTLNACRFFSGLS